MRACSSFWALLLALGLILFTTPASEAMADTEKPADKAAADEGADEESDDAEDEKAEEADDDAEDEDGKDEAKDDENDKDDKAKKKKRKTATVEQKPLKVTITVDGTFVARNMAAVTLKPEEWKSFEIEEIIPHGARVSEGEPLVKFDGEGLDEAIEELDLSQRLSDLSLRKAEEELPRLERSLEMSLANAKQSHERTHEDYERYKDEDREELIESIEMSLKSSQQRLDYAKDELEQLEKMYKADDLTEETEEIILTRTRQEFEMQEYYYERAKNRAEELLSISLPRQDQDNSEVVERVDIALERAKLSSQLDLNRARYELEKQRRTREKSQDRHAKLVQDRGLMTIKAPMEGVVYYGQCIDGKWGDMAGMQRKLLPEKSVPAGTTMMTVVDPDELYLVGVVAEKDLASVEPGQAAKIAPTAEGADPLKGEVEEVSSYPVAPGKFALEVDLAAGDKPAWLMPGMTGKVKITTYDNKKALLVSKKAVHSEEDDEDANYVWLIVEEDGEEEVEKREVELGKTKGDLVEIVDGLAKGDKVSLEDEEEDDKDED